MPARKISNDALKATLEKSKTLLETTIKSQKWMVVDVWDAVNFGENTQKRRADEKTKGIVFIDEAARNIRDIDHAIAALEQEIDDE